MGEMFGIYTVTHMYLRSKRKPGNTQKLVTTGLSKLSLVIKHFVKAGLQAATMSTVGVKEK